MRQYSIVGLSKDYIPHAHVYVFSLRVQCPCQQCVDMTDGKLMEHIVEAKALYPRLLRASSWVHLHH